MAAEDGPMETTINDTGMVTIPAAVRRRLDIEAGDKLRWTVTDDGGLAVEVLRQRHGAFDDFEPVALGGNGLETHDAAGHESDRGDGR